MSSDPSNPSEPPQLTGPALDPRAGRLELQPDDVAPIDWQADPAHWLPGRMLWIAAGVVLVATVVTIVICAVVWLTPPMHPVQVPTVGKL